MCALHRRVRGEEPQDRQGGPQGACTSPASRLDDLGNRRGAVPDRRRAPTYINCPSERDPGAAPGASTTTRTGRTEQDPNYMIFSQRNCNYPQAKYAILVADSVPAVGDARRHAFDYDGGREESPPGRPLRGGDEGAVGTPTAGADNTRTRFFDRITFDPTETGGVRDVVCRSQPQGKLKRSYEARPDCRAGRKSQRHSRVRAPLPLRPSAHRNVHHAEPPAVSTRLAHLPLIGCASSCACGA